MTLLDMYLARLRDHKRTPHKFLPLPGGLWLGVNDVNVSVGIYNNEEKQKTGKAK